MSLNSGHHNQLLLTAQALVRQLHPAILEEVSNRIAHFDVTDWQTSQARILSAIPQATSRALIEDLLEVWREDKDDLSPQTVSFALKALGIGGIGQRDEEKTEVVWTGPRSPETPFRRTRQALLQIIHSAVERLTVICFAVYKVDSIREALFQAANRGVHIRIIIESAEASGGKTSFDMIEGLGEELARTCTVFVWPAEKREADPTGRHGSLHAKALIADNHTLYVSSANLTEFALDLNLELGIVISGGQLPQQVDHHFTTLVRNGILVPIKKI